MEIKICEIIREKRRLLGISQEKLAEACGVTVQAVSKWETQNSLPDIFMLPTIAEFFHISMDALFFGSDSFSPSTAPASPVENASLPFSDDGVLRVVQYEGRRLIQSHTEAEKTPLLLQIPESEAPVSFEIWGSASIGGSINGSVSAGSALSCEGDINGSVSAGGSITARDIKGGVAAGDSVNCNKVMGSVSAGDDVICGDVGGNIDAGDNITCGNAGGSADAGGDITCGDIYGNVDAGGSVACSGSIKGGVDAGGNVSCTNVDGNIDAGGNVIINKQDQAI